MLYYDLINKKDRVDYGKRKDMVRTSKDISKECFVATFTTLSHVTLKIVNTCAMGAFFVEYTKKTAKDY